MDAGYRCRTFLACGILLLAASSAAHASLVQYSIDLSTDISEPHLVLLIGGGLALLAVLLQGEPGVRR